MSLSADLRKLAKVIRKECKKDNLHKLEKEAKILSASTALKQLERKLGL